MHAARYAESARRCNLLQSRRHVHSIPEDVIAIDDDVALVDADAKDDAAVLGNVDVPLLHGRLQVHGAVHRVDRAGKLHQQPVAGRLDEPPAVVGDPGVDEFAPERLQGRERTALVAPHQAGIADDVRRHDRCQPALLARQRDGSPTLPSLKRRGRPQAGQRENPRALHGAPGRAIAYEPFRRPDQGPKARVEGPSFNDKPQVVGKRSTPLR